MKVFGMARTFSISLLAFACAIGLIAIQPQRAFAQTRNITVQIDKPGATIPKTLFGLFFEDINFGADGGLYPERVKNRSFEFPDPMMGWKRLDRADTKGELYVFDQGSAGEPVADRADDVGGCDVCPCGTVDFAIWWTV